jgi:hypothetical protein
MSRKIDCPFIEGAFISLPDEWLGKHAARRDEAISQSREKKLPDSLARFASAMALLDDWSLPGLTGNPENWDLLCVPLNIIGWVSLEVLGDFFGCLNSPASYSPRSGNGREETTIPTPSPPGTSVEGA